MKKSLSVLLVLLLALSFIIAGCSSNQPAPDEGQADNAKKEAPAKQPEEQAAKETKLLMATGGTGGTYYPLGGAMAETWSNHIEGLKVTVQSTGASVENIRLLSNKQTELAMAMNGPAQAAVQGLGDFKEKVTNVAAIGVIYPEVMQVVTPQASGVQTIADLKGKRVSIGPPGSGTASAAVKILAAYGIDADKDITKFQDTFADAADKLKDGQLDAAFAVLAVPAANIIEISTATPVDIVDIDGDGLQKLLDSEPAFAPYEIPAGTYEGQDELGKTVAQWAVLYTQKELSDDLAYNLAKVMYENTDEIAAGHARGNQITLDNAIKGIKPVPFHPGAVKYYKEKGISVE
ncbi:TAXI family TRAP transporter solute-binding subunit [Metallumcola ferriviriculae]|uniref:TAXI family TRAP transporter solute-binding subunit n=1 Tax=Metallumcola ferriviriculae TaxID=3039180 RepID=A0AAU0UST3_9FIRM|nr:TAXI family TRAP transporter solute-binding subunit [Desulfitibacteraceae bacterium MK1]